MDCKAKALFAAIIVIGKFAGAQQDLSSTRSWSALKPILNEADIVSTSRSNQEVLQCVRYVDGFGRPVQTVLKQVSPTNKDAVEIHKYNTNTGWEDKRYLSFTSNVALDGDITNNGNYKADGLAQQRHFYNNDAFPGENGYAYAQVNIENSPLNRTLNSYGPGINWVGSSRGTTTQYVVNTIADKVQVWNINAARGSIPSSSGTYLAGKLYKTILTNQKGNQLIEYKDADGHMILKKLQLNATADEGTGSNHNGWLCTYYIYDDYGNLRFVISPKAVKQIDGSWTISQQVADELCYRYEYDLFNRIVIKKLPGAAEQWFVFDQRGRVVMVQDGYLRDLQKWQYFQFDGLDRPLANGLITDPAHYNDFTYHQSLAATSISYPDLSVYTSELLTQNYYDNYDWVNNSGSGLGSSPDLSGISNTSLFLTPDNNNFPYPQAIIQASKTRGLLTGMKKEVLGSSQYLYAANFYDDRGNVIQLQNTNIAGGIDKVTIQYTWTGKPLRKYEQHNKAGNNSQTHNVLTVMNYDFGGRLLSVSKSVSSTTANGTVAMPAKTIATYSYTELGQLKTKSLGNRPGTSSPLETLSFDYDLRGFLLGANRPFVATPSGGNNFFGFDLGYDKNGVIGTYTPDYNGNISGMTWKSAGDGARRKYDFTYDAANRLLKADFNQLFGDQWQKTDPMNSSYSLDFSVKMGDGADPLTAYDANGNIMAMQQWGMKLNNAQMIDNLRYNYMPNSNKLLSVTDFANDPQTTSGDFRTGAQHAQSAAKSGLTNGSAQSEFDAITDYTYNTNGNLTTDNNKGVSGIAYNCLNLVSQLNVNTITNGSGTSGTVRYIYDAQGIRLKKITTENSVPVPFNGAVYSATVTVTATYTGSFVYESKFYSGSNASALSALNYTDKLLFIAQEEGRIRAQYNNPSNTIQLTGFAADYYLQDHLGNVRMVLTDEQKQDRYPAATLEGDRSGGALSMINYEKQFYTVNTSYITPKSNVPGWSSSLDYQNNNGNPPPNTNYPAGYTVNSTDVSSSMYKLNASVNKTGLGIVLKVMAGDKLDILGKSYYYAPAQTFNNNNSVSLLVSDILGAFLGAPGSGAAMKGVTASQLQSWNSGSNALPASMIRGTNGEAVATPKAYINFIFFDNQFRYAGSSGASRVGGSGSVKSHWQEDPTLQGIVAPKNGYIYVYVSNESNTDVFFDNLQIVHTRGPILQDQAYSPWGLVLQGISCNALAFGAPANKIKFNGKEEQKQEFSDGSGLEWVDYGARMYDPQVGRWFATDPLAEKSRRWSQYNYGYDNPIIMIDADGMASDVYIDNTTDHENAQFDDGDVGNWVQYHDADGNLIAHWVNGNINDANKYLNDQHAKDGVILGQQGATYGHINKGDKPEQFVLLPGGVAKTSSEYSSIVAIAGHNEIAKTIPGTEMVEVNMDLPARHENNEARITDKGEDERSGWDNAGLITESAGFAFETTLQAVAGVQILANQATGMSSEIISAGETGELVGKGFAAAGFAITIADGLSNGWKPHHTADLVVNAAIYGIAASIPVAGWIVGGSWFIMNLISEHYTGKSLTENYFDH